MLTVTPYKAEHAMRVISMGARTETDSLRESPLARPMAEFHEQHGPAWTLFADDEVVGCGGVDIFNGKAEAWTLFSPLVKKYGKTAVRMTKLSLEGVISEYGLEKVTALVATTSPRAHVWIKNLGFELDPDTADIRGLDGRMYSTYRKVI